MAKRLRLKSITDWEGRFYPPAQLQRAHTKIVREYGTYKKFCQVRAHGRWTEQTVADLFFERLGGNRRRRVCGRAAALAKELGLTH